MGVVAAAAGKVNAADTAPDTEHSEASKRGDQRLSLAQLKKWEGLGYGMFIHYGMSTYVQNELPDGKTPPTVYAPDKLDVDQWVAVARDAGMKYAVLTTKHVAGHCLWPSKHTDYSVANSTDKTDVVGAFVTACRKYHVLPGFYYCSWDNHHRFGSKTPSDGGPWATMHSFPKSADEELSPYTTSVYQNFQTAQLTELITDYGPLLDIWVDIPGVLGPGYRTFLYEHLASLQNDIVIMMNSGIGDGATYNADYAWPSDLIAIERRLPPESGHQRWRTIQGKQYYMPGEVCDPIGKDWFYVEGDTPREDRQLQEMYENTRARHANLLLDIGPDKHGLIPKNMVDALNRLRKNVGL